MRKPLLIPAIDLFGGECVRLVKGDFAKMTIYKKDPIATALMMQDEGADVIHIVDLEGAKKGYPVHAELIAKIQSELSIPVETGGGIRTKESVANLIKERIGKVILGTISVTNMDLTKEILRDFPHQVILGLDVNDRNIAIQGWVKDSGISIDRLIETYRHFGLQEIIVTDIAQDGMLAGPNLALLSELTKKYTFKFGGIKVIASGGVSTKDDIEELCRIENLHGIIVGKAIYEGRVTVRQLRSSINAS